MPDASDAHDPHKPLRDDVRMLGELLGATLREREGTALFDIVERVRALAKSWRAGNDGDLPVLAALLRGLPQQHAIPVARGFAHFLTLANIAEQHHRIRRRRAYLREAGEAPQPGSLDDVLPRLLSSGITADVLHDTVAGLRVELVLTAHPTEIIRRTLIHKHQRIGELLAEEDRPDRTPAERAEIVRALRREIMAAWETDEIRERRPTPLDEVVSGLLVFEQTLWDAVPAYLRALDGALRRTTGRPLPLTSAPVRFGSWIGGDRDGNPHVTAAVTRRACDAARWIAADLYEREVTALRLELSVTDATSELRARAGGAREPYRALLKTVARRLRATRDRLGPDLEIAFGRAAAPAAAPAGTFEARRQEANADAPYERVSDLIEPLRLCYDSLVATGQQILADGRLADVLRRTAVFGLTLVKLDIRQHASRHVEALDAITRRDSSGSYKGWDEAQRQAFLVSGLRQPPAALDVDADAAVREVVDTFRAAAAINPESLSAYVVSMAEAPSDVLAVEYLQHRAGSRLRVVPLFEQVDSLGRAAGTMRDLLAVPEYRARINGRQEVMIGYSDSAKDGGRLAANWALYRAQESVVDVCLAAGVELTLFHGRGGSVGRGGGPTYLAIQSQPPGSVQGRLRVTEQGEMIQAQFGLPGIAVRTLEVYTAATLEATLRPGDAPRREWRTTMDRLASEARAAYRRLVYDDPSFVPYFRSATPEVELGEMPIGSRPARRDAGGGVESLRAIPWVFAWTQTRLMLPSWLGTAEALAGGIDRGDTARLRRMHDEWPFFRSTIDLIAMVLAKADARIAAEYDRQLVALELQPLGAGLRRQLREAEQRVLAVTGAPHLLDGNPVLRRSIDVRNPYVDPINLLQIELLRRIRAGGDAAPADLWHAFMVTVNGIAAGMRNTG